MTDLEKYTDAEGVKQIAKRMGYSRWWAITEGNKQFAHIAIYISAHGPGPYPCDDCGVPAGVPELNIHHVDHDHSNNSLSNLVAVHHGCHVRHHHEGKEISEWHRERIRNQDSFWSKKTHCPQGHEYTEENTYRGGGGRQCVTCRTMRNRGLM